MKFLILFLILFEFSAFTKELSDDYQIDWKYNAGKYLIYDCERNHYACVSQTGQDNCLEERKYAQGLKSVSFPCAPLETFKDQVDCIHKMYKIVDIGANKRFCYPKQVKSN